MLNTFRQGGITKIIMGGVVILIIGAFALDYRTSAPTSGDECVAKMDGECIPVSEYQTLLRLVAPPGATNKELRQAGFVKHAVDGLVERELLLREAKRLGVWVSEDELDAALALGKVHFSWPAEAPIPTALAAGRGFPITGAAPTFTFLRVTNSETGAFDYDIYKRQVQSRLRMSPKNFKELQQAEIVAARVRDLITNSVRVSEEEVWSRYAREKSNATARVVEAKTEWFARFATNVTEADVDAFIASNSALIDESWSTEQKNWTEDCALVSELLFAYEPGADEASQQKTVERAERAVMLLEKGVDFRTVARMASDASNATRGGALGCLLPDYGPGGADLVAAVEKLSPGGVTPVLESPKGRHVFLFHGKLDKEKAEALGRREVARQLAVEKAAQERAKAFASQLIELAKSGAELEKLAPEKARELVAVPVTGDAAAVLVELATSSELAPTMEVSRTFTRNGSPIFGIKDDFDATSALFELPKADELLPAPVETFSGFAVLQLKEKSEATREDFEKEKAELTRAAREQRRSEVLMAYVSRLRSGVKKLELNPRHTSEAQDGDAEGSPGESG